jgi:trans-2,3-dihydro-3-hydroxyanthranilate isomerase
MSLRFTTLDVFTDRPFGGNPLAVFCDQPEMSVEVMQTIAQEFNLSETVFIVPPRDQRALRRLRIFTPATELPFAGHPTIGAIHTLVESGIAGIKGERGEFELELEVGRVRACVQRRKNAPPFLQFVTARLPEQLGVAPDAAGLASILGLEEQDIVRVPYTAQTWSCGVPFLFVPVKDRAALARAQPNMSSWREVMKSAKTSQVFVYCRQPELPGSHFRARMFAPELGIIEDPATGGAAAAFAGYLAARQHADTGTYKWVVEQGFEMGRPSLLYVEADTSAGKVTAVRVGGTAVTMSEGTLLVATR